MPRCHSNICPASMAEHEDTMSIIQPRFRLMTTGLSELDKALETIGGKYVSITGQPGHGKTDFTIAVAANAIRKGQPVLFVSLEIGHRATVKRFVANFGNALHPDTDIPLQRLGDAKSLNGDQQVALAEGVSSFDECKQHLYLVDGTKEFGGANARFVEHISAMAKALTEKYGEPCYVICDYFQLLGQHEESGTTTEKLDAVSRKLATLAHGTGCAVITPCSVNKDSSVRGSGQVHYDNDITLELRLDCAKNEVDEAMSSSIRPMDVYIMKNRDGLAGAHINVDYRPASHRYFDTEEA